MRAKLLMGLALFLVAGIGVFLNPIKAVPAAADKEPTTPSGCPASDVAEEGSAPAPAHVGGADECNARCILSFCRHVGERCQFTHTVLRNNGDCCCEYNCVPDPSCTSGSRGPKTVCPGT